MACPALAMRAGTRRMVRRTGPGVKRRIWAMSRSKAARSMARSSSFSWRSSGGHAVEEQVDREDDDDEVVEATEDRQAVGDEIAAEHDVAGRGPEQDLAVARHPLVEDERRDQAAVLRDPARDRQERQQRHHPAEACPPGTLSLGHARCSTPLVCRDGPSPTPDGELAMAFGRARVRERATCHPETIPPQPRSGPRSMSGADTISATAVHDPTPSSLLNTYEAIDHASSLRNGVSPLHLERVPRSSSTRRPQAALTSNVRSVSCLARRRE